MQQLTPVVKGLIILNVVVHVLAHFLHILPLGILPLYFSSEHFQPYQLVTHMFTHGSNSHILFNMLGLFFFGPMVEMALGQKRFFTLYFAAGAGAILLHMAMAYALAGPGFSFNQMPRVVGASGCIFGVLAAFGMRFPNQRVMLIFPPIPMKAWVMVTGYAVIEIFSGFTNMASGIAHFAHVGGAIVGAALVWIWMRQDTNKYRIN